MSLVGLVAAEVGVDGALVARQQSRRLQMRLKMHRAQRGKGGTRRLCALGNLFRRCFAAAKGGVERGFGGRNWLQIRISFAEDRLERFT